MFICTEMVDYKTYKSLPAEELFNMCIVYRAFYTSSKVCVVVGWGLFGGDFLGGRGVFRTLSVCLSVFLISSTPPEQMS